jgi:hypothetical protein
VGFVAQDFGTVPPPKKVLDAIGNKKVLDAIGNKKVLDAIKKVLDAIGNKKKSSML